MRQDDESMDATAAGDAMTPGRFATSLLIACLLMFAMLVVMAMAGLGRYGVVPAAVVAMAFTARITKIRRPLWLLVLGLLSLAIVVGLTYAVAIAMLDGAATTGGGG